MKHGMKSGFTLVETLVVIAIIAIMATMLLAAMPRMRERREKMICLSNLKQIGILVPLYTAEHNGEPPSGIQSDLWEYQTTNPFPSSDHVSPVPRTIFDCPTARRTYNTNMGAYRAYAWNQYATRVYHPKLTALTKLSQIALIAEANSSYLLNVYANNITNRHAGLCTVLYGDCHVEQIRLTADITNGPASLTNVFWGF